jgi:hypothetical protein
MEVGSEKPESVYLDLYLTMLYNPVTKDLFTSDGRFLKRLHCPLNTAWDELEPDSSTDEVRHCAACHHSVTDTALVSETALVQLLRQDPDACLKICVEQPNIELTPNVSKHARQSK